MVLFCKGTLYFLNTITPPILTSINYMVADMG